jgi:Peptidase family M23
MFMKLAITLAMFTASIASAAPLTLELPLQCEMGKDCFIQNYVDAEAGKGYSDFLCRKLSYDGHKGTDFRVGTFHPEHSPNVLASADGVVARLRDGVEDLHLKNPKKADVSNLECGNAVVIAHEGGWETQYCHLQRGSLAVKQGQQVKAGDVLGRVGLSGNTEFPHVHLSVRNEKGQDIDPFTGSLKETLCNDKATLAQSLWSSHAQSKLSLKPTGYLASGFAAGAVDIVDILEGKYNDNTVAKEAVALVFWAVIYGAQDGDEMTLVLLDADKNVMVQHTEKMKKFYAQYSQFIGKKRQGEGAWKAGNYEGIVSLKRGDDVLINEAVTLTVK